MNRAFLIPASLMIGCMAQAQTAPEVPNVQTGQVDPAAAAPAPKLDTRAITQADSGSSIDKPPVAGTEPETGYHAPAIPVQKQADAPPHTRPREAVIQPAAAPKAAKPVRCKRADGSRCRIRNRR